MEETAEQKKKKPTPPSRSSKFSQNLALIRIYTLQNSPKATHDSTSSADSSTIQDDKLMSQKTTPSLRTEAPALSSGSLTPSKKHKIHPAATTQEKGADFLLKTSLQPVKRGSQLLKPSNSAAKPIEELSNDLVDLFEKLRSKEPTLVNDSSSINENESTPRRLSTQKENVGTLPSNDNFDAKKPSRKSTPSHLKLPSGGNTEFLRRVPSMEQLFLDKSQESSSASFSSTAFPSSEHLSSLDQPSSFRVKEEMKQSGQSNEQSFEELASASGSSEPPRKDSASTGDNELKRQRRVRSSSFVSKKKKAPQAPSQIDVGTTPIDGQSATSACSSTSPNEVPRELTLEETAELMNLRDSNLELVTDLEQSLQTILQTQRAPVRDMEEFEHTQRILKKLHKQLKDDFFDQH